MAIKVFIGTEEAQWLPTEVLKHSARRRSSQEIEFRELKEIPLNLKLKMYTGFSFYRFSIPEACQFQGRAIYLDADILVLSDLALLFNQDLKGKGVLARPQTSETWYTSVMLLDCAQLKHWKIHEWVTLINANIASYHGTMWGDSNGLNHKDFGPLEQSWNHLDRADASTKILHYTHVPTQPWKVPGHPFAYLFLQELKSALEEGVVTPQSIEKEIQAGYVYPQLLEDVGKVTT
jgi:hypothetical protein